MTPDLTTIILTHNEAIHIARAIRSVEGISRRILVVDSFSTDATVEIARGLGAEVMCHPFVNQARQFQWAMDNGGVDTAWVLRLDADEIIEDDLAAEIAERLPALGPETVGVNLKRKHIFLGRWIRHGGRYPLLMLRIFRAGHGRVEDRWMDEHILVEGGDVVVFEGGFADHNLNGLGYFIDKHNRYATREAVQTLIDRSTDAADPMRLSGGSRQARFKRYVKTRLYDRVPYHISSLAYFLYRYFIRIGFADGYPGLIYHFLQGFWYRFLVGSKIYEIELGMRGLSAEERPAHIARVTGVAP
ncbi:glycosyltransferase family 2 protein [Amaricoccus sp. W119]|uniref:glycosyltransferase family 2 protein n=1 Tax=Amaricoccus sp. W119 TaxID=3391833 RepID=UPI0039A445B5